MKALQCELCGSTDIVKQDGLFVCQHCGTKYSLDEAKKLLGEDTVKVTIDNSVQIDKIISAADEAFADARYETAEKYYSEALEIEPNNPQMTMRHALSILGRDGFENGATPSCYKMAEKSIELISENKSIEDDETVLILIKDLERVGKEVRGRISEILDPIESEIFTLEYNLDRSTLDILADLGRPSFEVTMNNNSRDSRKQSLKMQAKPYEKRNDSIIGFESKIKAKLLELLSPKGALQYYLGEDWESKIGEAKGEALKAKKQYLDEHPEIVENKKKELNELKKQLNEEKEKQKNVENGEEYDELFPKKAYLQNERDSIGIFKIKEKKALDAQINEVDARMKELSLSVKNARAIFDKKIAAIENDIKSIEEYIKC